MAYIDQAFFSTYNPVVSIPEEEFLPLAERASDVIDMITMQKIQTSGIASFAEPIQTAIKKATAAELDTLYAQGGLSALVGNSDTDTASFSIGKFSMGGGRTQSASSLRTMNGIPISPLINGYLLTTGLLYRGMGWC